MYEQQIGKLLYEAGERIKSAYSYLDEEDTDDETQKELVIEIEGHPYIYYIQRERLDDICSGCKQGFGGLN